MSRAEHAPLVDMSGVNLRALAGRGKLPAALGRSIKRLIASLNDPNGVISAFSSFVE